MILAYVNPYFGKNFAQFFSQFFRRVSLMVQGQLGLSEWVSDEVQIFVLIGVSMSAALVGTFLMLRKMTMLANALSHTILLGIVLAFAIGRYNGAIRVGHTLNIEAMLGAAVIMGVVTTFLTELLTKTMRLQEDASIGIVFTTLFALGVVFVTMMTRSAHVSIEAVMGNVDALHIQDLRLVYLILLINLALFTLFYKEFKITTFDPGLAKVMGISTVFFNYLLMIQVSATAIGAFRAVGVLMVLAFITGPVLTARLFTSSLKGLLALSALIGSVISVMGVALSRHLLSVHGVALSTAGVTVCLIAVVYIVAAAVALKQRRVS